MWLPRYFAMQSRQAKAATAPHISAMPVEPLAALLVRGVGQ